MTKGKPQPKPTPLSDLRARNLARRDSLAAQGAVLHPMSLVMCYLAALTTKLGADYELELELEESLERAEAELMRAKLTQGLTLPDFNDKETK